MMLAGDLDNEADSIQEAIKSQTSHKTESNWFVSKTSNELKYIFVYLL